MSKAKKLIKELMDDEKHKNFSNEKFSVFSQTLLNDREFDVTTVKAISGEIASTDVVNPSEIIGDVVSNVAKRALNLDSADATIVKEKAELTKNEAKSLMTAAHIVDNEWLKTGATLKFPAYSDMELQLGAEKQAKKEGLREIYSIPKEGEERKLLREEEFTVDEHYIVSVKKKTPAWLKHAKVVKEY